MQAVSHALMKLYEAAFRVPFPEFSSEALQILDSLVGFDAALLASAECTEGESKNKDGIGHTCELARIEHHARTQAQTAASALRPILIGQGPTAASCSGCIYRYPSTSRAKLLDPHAMLSLKVLRNPRHDGAGPRWLALFRRRAASFTADEKARLDLMWPHFGFAHAINRRYELDRLVEGQTCRAVAFASESGRLLAADPHFITLLRLEWPHRPAENLHLQIPPNLTGSHVFCGERIEVSMKRHPAYISCAVAIRSSATRALTESELIVAKRFATGLSNKKIAQQLGVSNNTVRSHIASAYSKLHVHNKAELAQLLGCPTCASVYTPPPEVARSRRPEKRTER